MTVKVRLGIRRSKFLRLCCRAPRTTMASFMGRKLTEGPLGGWWSVAGDWWLTSTRSSEGPKEAPGDEHDDGARGRNGNRSEIELALGDLTPSDIRAEQSA